MAKTIHLFQEYCDAVERDVRAHPIQPAHPLLEATWYATAADLYADCVSPYDGMGNPLPVGAPITAARWLIYDNVYQRTSGGRSPRNAKRVLGELAGFQAAGRTKLRRTPALAASYWRGAVAQFGLPPGFNGAVTPGDGMPIDAPAGPVSEGRAGTGGAERIRTAMVGKVEPPAIGGPEWAERIVQEVRQLWEQNEGRYPSWTSGFEVFYSPVREGADLIVVGENPGGGAEVFDVDLAARIPSEHQYFRYDYPMARRMRALFERAGHLETLRLSVKLNLNFFRSRDRAAWLQLEPGLRHFLEKHCCAAVRQVIQMVEPKMVLCEGMATFDQIVELLEHSPRTTESLAWTTWRGRRVRAYARSRDLSGSTVVGIIHPTGSGPAFLAAQAEIAALLASDLD